MSTRVQRLRDFDNRCNHSQPSLVEGHYAQYLTIHPFSDDVELLRAIDWPSEKCAAVDAYLKTDDEVYFVETLSSLNTAREPGLYAGRMMSDQNMKRFSIVVHEPVISRDLFNRTIIALLKKNLTLLAIDHTSTTQTFINSPDW